jgi:cardiolipin hydrolase
MSSGSLKPSCRRKPALHTSGGPGRRLFGDPATRRLLDWAPAFAGVTTLCLTLLHVAYATDPRVYFSSQDNIQEQLRQAITQSMRTIDGAVYDVSSPVLQQALRLAASRGVSIRLIVDRTQHPSGNLSRWWDPALSIRHIAGRRKGHGAMHHKFAIFDGAEVVTGSYNWTPGARYVNHENIIFEDDPGIVTAYQQQFDHLWESGEDASRDNDHPTRHHRKRSRHKKASDSSSDSFFQESSSL